MYINISEGDEIYKYIYIYKKVNALQKMPLAGAYTTNSFLAVLSKGVYEKSTIDL